MSQRDLEIEDLPDGSTLSAPLRVTSNLCRVLNENVFAMSPHKLKIFSSLWRAFIDITGLVAGLASPVQDAGN